MNLARSLKELQKGRLIDVAWTSASRKISNQLDIVEIPLTKGLIGFRVFLSHKNNIEKLKKIKNLESLRKIILCQGAYWADTDILLIAGLTLLQNTSYEGLFQQTYIRRCDAFPRGINEALSELAERKENMPNLILYDDLLLYYPSPTYFLTSPKNLKVNNILQSGLELAIDDGSFDNYIKTHPTTKDLFPLSNWKDATFIKLNNPFLPSNLDTSNPRYWITPELIFQ